MAHYKTNLQGLAEEVKMRKVLVLTCASVMFLSLSFESYATPIIWDEQGDAGGGGNLDFLSNAQQITGTSLDDNVIMIRGTLQSGNDVDVFQLNYTAASFSATTANSDGWSSDSLNDPQFFLFDWQNIGIVANDDIGYGELDAHIPLGAAVPFVAPVDGSTLFLAISGYDNDPINEDGDLVFQSYPYSGVYGALPWQSARIAGWSQGNGEYAYGDERERDYTIVLTGSTVATTVPEPATMFLFGSGLFGLVGIRLRRKKN